MSLTGPVPPAAVRLTRRLVAAARATRTARDAAAVRCATPVAVDAWGAVSERCPLPQHHPGEHEVESESARRDRLVRASALPPGEVLVAVETVTAWLARAGDTGAMTARPVRELWMLLDLAEARATSPAGHPHPTRGREEVAPDA